MDTKTPCVPGSWYRVYSYKTRKGQTTVLLYSLFGEFTKSLAILPEGSRVFYVRGVGCWHLVGFKEFYGWIYDVVNRLEPMNNTPHTSTMHASSSKK